MMYSILLILLALFSQTQEHRVNISSAGANVAPLPKRSSDKVKEFNLYDLIGVNFNSPQNQSFIAGLGACELKDFSLDMKDYRYKNDGIQIRTDLNGTIEVLFLFNYKPEWKHLAFKGKLPFNLTFEDTFDEVKSKIGEGEVLNHYGFYGRVYKWELQDNLRLFMELKLPKEENEEIFIQQISLSKRA